MLELKMVDESSMDSLEYEAAFTDNTGPMIRITPVPADLWRLVIQCVGATTSGILDAIITTGDIVRYEEQIPLCEETLNLKMITAGYVFPLHTES